MAETKRTVGPVSVAGGAGAGAGYAAAEVLVWLVALFGVDASPIQAALGLLLTVGGAVFGGWLVKPGGGTRVAE